MAAIAACLIPDFSVAEVVLTSIVLATVDCARWPQIASMQYSLRTAANATAQRASFVARTRESASHALPYRVRRSSIGPRLALVPRTKLQVETLFLLAEAEHQAQQCNSYAQYTQYGG